MNDHPTRKRWAIRGWLLAGFVLGLIVFLGVNVASYLSARQSIETARWVRQTEEVLAQVQELRTHAADAQAGMRGYVISGREDFLAPYQIGMRELPNDQRRLRQFLAGNPRQMERLQRLDALIAGHLEKMRASVDLRRNQGLEAAVAQVSSGRGKQIMDQIRSLAGEIEQEERSLLAGRESQAGDAVSKMLFILPVGTLLGFGLLIMVLFFLNAEMAERQRTEADKAAILASALDCIIAMDRQGRVIEWNPAAEKAFGYPRTVAMGNPLVDLIIPARFREAHTRGLARFLEDGAGPMIGKLIEMPALHRDGNEFPVELSIVVSRADELFFTAYLRDITERKRMELAVRESEERFRTMANSIPQLTWMAHADGFIFWYNQRWYDYTGTTPEQMEGWGWQRVHDPAVLPGVMANWTGAIASGKRFDMEFPLRGADGKFRTFLTRVEPLMDSEGRVVQWFGTNTDVEALKQSQERLRHSEEFNRRIVESSSDCIKVLDLEARLLSMSEGGQRLLEIRDINRYLKNSWVAFWRPEDQPQVREAVADALAGGVGRFQAFCPSEAGNPRWWDVIVSPIRGASEQVDQLLSISRDISAQVHAEEKIRQINAELEQRVRERTAQLEVANKELEAFSYSVSHDLRAPLRGLNGYVQMLVEDYGDRLDAEGKRLIGVVSSEAKRMGRLIDDLLAFSRMGRQHMQKSQVDVAALARGVFEVLTNEKRGTTPRFELQPLPPAMGDPAMLRQVLTNLLDNAIKFSRQQPLPVIEVGGSSGVGENIYFVKDNGAGFDERYAAKLFGVFQRLHSEAEFEGTGVGLALVQGVIHRHGGRVWAESKAGMGATFYFTLPTQKESNL